MKRVSAFLCLFALLIHSPLFAQPAGEAAAESAQKGQNNEWQSWVFAGGSAVTATAALIVVALNSGSGPASQAH